jgi:hypothetical protein
MALPLEIKKGRRSGTNRAIFTPPPSWATALGGKQVAVRSLTTQLCLASRNRRSASVILTVSHSIVLSQVCCPSAVTLLISLWIVLRSPSPEAVPAHLSPWRPHTFWTTPPPITRSCYDHLLVYKLRWAHTVMNDDPSRVGLARDMTEIAVTLPGHVSLRRWLIALGKRSLPGAEAMVRELGFCPFDAVVFA